MIDESTRRLTSFVILGLLLLFFYLSGCSGGKSRESNQTEKQNLQELKGKITIAGSSSMQPVSEVLADKFRARHPEVRIDVQVGDSSQGIAALRSGVADIGCTSRELNSREKKQGLVETQIAMDGIAVVVHPSNNLAGMGIDDVEEIFSGSVNDWEQLGGKKGPITVICREEGSGTRSAFDEMVFKDAGKQKKSIKNSVVEASTGAVRTAVAGNPQAIGYISLASLNDEVKALSINGTEASVANVSNGSYVISRPFIYLTRGHPSGLNKAFIDFVLSKEGQTIVENQGAIAIK